MPDGYLTKARSLVTALCGVQPNRRTGSPGNRQATALVARTLLQQGYEVDATPFDCLDYVTGGAELRHGDEAFDVHVSPYSLGCDVSTELATVSTVTELEETSCEGKLPLMKGSICSEQLMPKNFVFYNPERHQRTIALLERQKPAAVITATGFKPEQAGALDPFPLIVDGDFDFPSVYCKDSVGDALSKLVGEKVRLRIDATRLDSEATNVVATLHAGAPHKVIVTAHVDAYENSPGALDNASGTVVLLLCAEMLSGYEGGLCLEFVALNGEDHYSAGGQMDYLRRYSDRFPRVALAVNVDGVGYPRGRSCYSFYECPAALEAQVEDALRRHDGLARGPQWSSGDHMIFAQQGVPCLALTSQYAEELMVTVTHTSRDTPDTVDCGKLVEVTRALVDVVRAL